MITNNAILSYPAIFEPRKTLSGKRKYSCTLLFNKTDTEAVAALYRAVELTIFRGAKTGWNMNFTKSLHLPIRDGDKEMKINNKIDPLYAGKVFISCSNDSAPGVIALGGRKLTDRTKLHTGSIVRANLIPCLYKCPDGVSLFWRLDNIMLIINNPPG